MLATIYAVPISDLTKIDQNLNESFFEQLLKTNHNLGVAHEKYFIINNRVNINIYANLPQVYKNYSIFVRLEVFRHFTDSLSNTSQRE